jgi:hypothetical protein
MATKEYYFSGTINWAKRSIDDRFATKDNPGNWTINLIPDEASKALMKESGLRLRPQADGSYKFKRPVSREFKGVIKEFGPPTFLIVQDGKKVEYDGIVGNGSTGMIKVEVYDSAMGKGHRYIGVLVEKLVEYTPPETKVTADRQAAPF